MDESSEPANPCPHSGSRRYATVLHALGVTLDELAKNTGINRPVFSTGKPVTELFG
jgi:hypothetical protein